MAPDHLAATSAPVQRSSRARSIATQGALFAPSELCSPDVLEQLFSSRCNKLITVRQSAAMLQVQLLLKRGEQTFHEWSAILTGHQLMTAKRAQKPCAAVAAICIVAFDKLQYICGGIHLHTGHQLMTARRACRPCAAFSAGEPAPRPLLPPSGRSSACPRVVPTRLNSRFSGLPPPPPAADWVGDAGAAAGVSAKRPASMSKYASSALPLWKRQGN